MQRDPRVDPWDALTAADAITDFTLGRSRADFEEGLLLRSAVERQFEIIGEALNQLARISPDLAQQVPELARIVAFRNILAHGYAIVDNRPWRLLASQRGMKKKLCCRRCEGGGPKQSPTNEGLAIKRLLRFARKDRQWLYGYFRKNDIVWEAAQDQLPALRDTLRQLLGES